MRATYYLLRSFEAKGSSIPVRSMAEIADSISELDDSGDFGKFPIARRTLSDGREIEGVLFHSSHSAGEPSWLAHAEQLTGATLRTGRVGARHRACLVLSVRRGEVEHVFLVIYGNCGSLVDTLPLEPSFGMKIVANAKKAAGFRKIQQNSYRGRRPMSVTERSATKAGLNEFDIPRRLSSVKRVSAELETERPIIAEGGRGFKFFAPTDVTDLFGILDQVLAWWGSGQYLDARDAILDRFEPERDQYV